MTGSRQWVWEPEPVTPSTAPERERPSAVDEWSDMRTERSALRRWRDFVHRYGWRAYALPLLVVITVLALFTTNTNGVRTAISGGTGGGGTGGGGIGGGGTGGGGTAHEAGSNTPPTAASSGQLKVDNPGAGSMNEALPSAALPPGPDYTKQGTGSYATVPGASAVIGKGQLHKFSIEVENGITGVDLKAFAATVMSTLSDRHSWTAGQDVALQRVDSGPVDFHVTLVSSMTVRSLCGYELPVETSCFSPDHDNRVVLNVARWVRGDVAYVADLANYHRYMVNHEVGHALGHVHIMACLPGGLAPVMMQQTITLKATDGKMCQPNPWPFP
jgi:hypothetical protein